MRRAILGGVLFDRDGTLIIDVPYNGDPGAVFPLSGASAAPGMVLDAARALGVAPTTLAVVGDIGADVEVAVSGSGAEVVLLCSPRGRAAAELLPGVHRIIEWNCPWVDPVPQPVRAPEVVALVAALASLRPAGAVVLTSYHQSPLPTALLLRLAGMRRITGASTETRHPVADRDDVLLVHVSDFNELMWDSGRAPTAVVRHGIPDPGYRYRGELRRAAVVVNEPLRRGRITGIDLLPRFAAAAGLDVFGMGLGGLGARLGLAPDWSRRSASWWPLRGWLVSWVAVRARWRCAISGSKGSCSTGMSC